MEGIEINTIEDIDRLFPDEETARKYLAFIRWGKWAKCPHCGNGKAYFIDNGTKYKCADKRCYKKFSVTSRTLIEATNIPLTMWVKIVFTYVKTRGRCLSFEIENVGIKSPAIAFGIKDKLDFVWKLVKRDGHTNTTLTEQVFYLLFNNYEYYNDFLSSKYLNKWHISDSDINNIRDEKQYNILLYYTRYYLNVYCRWIWFEFAKPEEILSEVFIRMHDEGIKEYNGSSMIKLIQNTINKMWYHYYNNVSKYANQAIVKNKFYKRNLVMNLSECYVAERVYRQRGNTMTKSQIKNNPELLNKKREEIIAWRKKCGKTYDFISHFD